MICACDIPCQPEFDTTTSSKLIEFNVVVHICFDIHHLEFYKNEVRWAVDELNRDFAGNSIKPNPYTIAKYRDLYNQYIKLSDDAKIIFKLEKIIHKPIPQQTSVNIGFLNTQIKDVSQAISAMDTLNIWIADLQNIHGYAQYPWELTSGVKYDGVVIARSVFGRCAYLYPYSLNKTLTHMVGHWLGLVHVFTTDKLVSDIPEQHFHTCGDPMKTLQIWPKTNMYMNFMDLTDDSSRFMFTKKQIEKMRNSVYTYRRQLIGEQKPVELPKAITPQIPDIWEYHVEKDDPHQWNLITRFNKLDAKITRNKGDDVGISVKRLAAAEIQVNMAQVKSATLTFSVKNALSTTTVMFRTSDKLWQRARISSKSEDWEQITIPLPKPFGDSYIIRFQASNLNHYTIFNNLLVKKI